MEPPYSAAVASSPDRLEACIQWVILVVACAKIWLPLLIGLGVPRSRRSLRLTTDRSQRAFGRPVPLPALRSRSVLECRSRGSRPPALRPKRAARDSPVGSSQRYRLSKAPNRPQIGIAASKQPFDPKGDEWVQHCLATLGARTATVLAKRRLQIDAPLRQEPNQLFEPLVLLPHAVYVAPPKISILLCAEKIRATTYAHSGRPICCQE